VVFFLASSFGLGLAGSKEEFSKAMTLLWEQDWEQASRSLERFIAEHPRDDRVSEASLHLARCSGEPGKATTVLQALLKRDARSGYAAEALEMLGRLHLLQGRPDVAVGEFEKALALMPSPERRVRTSRAAATALVAAGKGERAHKVLSELLAEEQADVSFSLTRLMLAELAVRDSSGVEAFEQYSRLLLGAPLSIRPQLLWRCGLIAGGRGDVPTQQKFWEALADSYPQTPQGRQAAIRLSQVPNPGLVSGRFAIQVGAYRLRDMAQGQLSELRAAGEPAFLAPPQYTPEGQVYRVWVGEFGAEEEARIALRRVRERRGCADAFIVAR
jgi:Tfp pilus assembly protein PilF